VLGAVHALGEEVEVDMVVDDVNGLVERVVVLAHCRHPVADAEDGQDAQEVEDLGHHGVLEDVAPRDEHLPHVVRRKQHQGIHQRVAVVDTENHGTALRQVLFPVHLKTPVGSPRVPVDVGQ